MINKISYLFCIIFLLCHISTAKAEPYVNRHADLRHDILHHIGTYDKDAYLTILRYVEKGIKYDFGMAGYMLNDQFVYEVNIIIANEDRTEIYFNDFFQGKFNGDYSDIFEGISKVELPKTFKDRDDFFENFSDSKRVR